MGLSNNLGKLSNMITSTGSAVGIGTTSPWGKLNVVAGTNLSFVVQDSGTADTIELTNYASANGIRAIQLNASVLTFGTGTAGGGSVAERLRIASTGQVLIGTTTALFNTQLNINYNQSNYEGLAISTDKVYNGSPQPNLVFGGKYNSSGSYRQFATLQAFKDNATDGDSAASLAFSTNGNSASPAEKMRITSAGNVGIGTSSPSSILQIGTGGGGATTRTTLQYSNGGYSATNLPSAPGSYSDGDKLIFWDDGSGKSSIGVGNAYNMIIQSTGASNAAIQFFTGTSGASTEKMRITSGGNVCINAPENVNVKIQCYSSGTTTSTYAMALYDSAANGLFYVRSDGTISMPKYGNGTMTISGGAIVVTSDKNLKKEDGFIENALDKVLKLTPRYFYWKDDSGIEDTSRQLGFYAQEVNEALGEEVANTPKDENDKWGIYDRGIIAMLTKAIQELNQQNQDLKSRLDKAGL